MNTDSELQNTDRGSRFYQFFLKDLRLVFKLDELGKEIAEIAIPAALALAADPVASLVDTAFVGRLGPAELAAVGVSIAVFNQVSKIAIYPLVSVTTSFVAEENAHAIDVQSEEDFSLLNTEMKELSLSASSLIFKSDRRQMSSVSLALGAGGVLGILQAVFPILAAKPALSLMGIGHDSPMLDPALRYLTLRSLGAPAVLLSLAMQGVFRGLKDSKAPLYATVAGDFANIFLDWLFIFVFHLNVSGAAIAHIISQYLISLILLSRVVKQVEIIPPSLKDLQFDRFFKNGFLLLWRVIAVTFCVTLAESLAARMGATIMSAFQICLQVWLATSLLADGLAVAGQLLRRIMSRLWLLHRAYCSSALP